jgi:hypothetical protein
MSQKSDAVKSAAITAAMQVATYIHYSPDTEENVLKRFRNAYHDILSIVEETEPEDKKAKAR